MASVEIVEFSRLGATKPYASGLDWDELVGRLTLFSERDQKDGPGWSPAIYAAGTTRGNENVVAITAAVIDIDHEEPEWGLLNAFEYVAHTTYSHTDEDRHWRVILPFVAPVARAEWGRTWRKIQFWLAPAADEACKDESRFYWWPTCRPEAPRDVKHHRGQFLDPDTLRDVPEQRPPLRIVDRPIGQPDAAGERPGDRFARETDWSSILSGWTLLSTRGPVRKWERPENGIPKQTPGCSATTGGGGHDVLYVFSSNAQPFDPNTSYTKFRAYSLLEHGGEDHVAASALGERYRDAAVGPTVNFDAEWSPSSAPSELPIIEDAPEEEIVSWHVFDITDFLNIEFPPIEWRVEGFLRERAILFSFGAPGSIKTFVATDAALAIASGDRFLNCFQCRQGSVLIVQEDTLASDYQQAYLRPMMAARGLTGADLRGRLFIAPQAEFALDHIERLRDLCAWLEIHKPDLLILDAFYLMYSGRKEDLLSVMKLIKKIRNKYGCSIWIIDHNRKGQGDASGENPIDRLINGREKSAAVDVVMESRPVKGEQGSAFIEVLKLRGAKMPEAVRVTYADGRITVDGEDDITPKGAAQTVYEWLCREGASRTIKQIIKGSDLAERTVRGAISELHVAGLVRPMEGVSGVKNWYALRRSDADPEPEPTNGPDVLFDEGF